MKSYEDKAYIFQIFVVFANKFLFELSMSIYKEQKHLSKVSFTRINYDIRCNSSTNHMRCGPGKVYLCRKT